MASPPPPSCPCPSVKNLGCETQSRDACCQVTWTHGRMAVEPDRSLSVPLGSPVGKTSSFYSLHLSFTLCFLLSVSSFTTLCGEDPSWWWLEALFTLVWFLALQTRWTKTEREQEMAGRRKIFTSSSQFHRWWNRRLSLDWQCFSVFFFYSTFFEKWTWSQENHVETANMQRFFFSDMSCGCHFIFCLWKIPSKVINTGRIYSLEILMLKSRISILPWPK